MLSTYYFNVLDFNLNNSFIYSLLYYFNFLKKNFFILIVLYLLNALHSLNSYKLITLLTVLNLPNFSWVCVLDQHNWPQTLNYGFNLLHPILFYLTFIFVGSRFFNAQILQDLHYRAVYLLGLASLILGMYWGGVNESWGFFWTYDNIELSLLSLIILIFFHTHTLRYAISWLPYIYCYLLLIIFIVMLRLGNIPTVHSFFSANINSIFFFEVFLTIVIVPRYRGIINAISYLFVVTYLSFNAIIVKKISYPLRKKTLIGHTSIGVVAVLLLNSTTYYNIFNLNINFLFDHHTIQLSSAVTNYLTVKKSSLIQYTLSWWNVFRVVYYQHLYYSYTYYMGFFYFFLIPLIISLLKIYVK